MVQRHYDFGIVPSLERLTYAMPVYGWENYSAGDKPIFFSATMRLRTQRARLRRACWD